MAAAAAASASAASAAATTSAAAGVTAHQQQQMKAVSGLFEKGKEQYDDEVRRAVLGYDDLSALATAAIGATASGTATNVLCVGCGTGTEVLAVARAGSARAAAAAAAGAPALRVTGVDPAAAMIATARKRVASDLTAAEQARVTLLNGFVHDLNTGDAPALVPGSFDGATSLLVMHLVPDVAPADVANGSTAGSGKLAYLHSIAKCLKPNARLFLVDGCGDSTHADPALHALLDGWVEYVRARGATDTLLSALKSNALKWGKIVPVARVTQLLAAAGFVDVQHVYQAFHFNGFTARYAGAAAAATK